MWKTTIITAILSAFIGGLSGVLVDRISIEHRVTVVETEVAEIKSNISEMRDDLKSIKNSLAEMVLLHRKDQQNGQQSNRPSVVH